MLLFYCFTILLFLLCYYFTVTILLCYYFTVLLCYYFTILLSLLLLLLLIKIKYFRFRTFVSFLKSKSWCLEGENGLHDNVCTGGHTKDNWSETVEWRVSRAADMGETCSFTHSPTVMQHRHFTRGRYLRREMSLIGQK